ncbi:hypothetical protein V1294_000113 [Bradyrhizobium sp. AZCC 1678]
MPSIDRGFERAQTFARLRQARAKVTSESPHEIPQSKDIFSVSRAVVGHLPLRAVVRAKGEMAATSAVEGVFSIFKRGMTASISTAAKAPAPLSS